MAFMAPIGTAEERATGNIWPGRWKDETGYNKLYSRGYHTGADLNLNHPHWDANAHSEVVAMGDGTVVYAKRYPNPKAWGNIIVVDHGEFEGKPLLSRYAHVENMMVELHQTVEAGQPIANVGNGDGLFAYHLHFDISRTDVLRTSGGHWPGFTQSLVLLHYVNPQEWLQMHVEGGITNLNFQVTGVYYVSATLGLRVRAAPTRSALQVGALHYGTRIQLVDTETVNADSFTWGRINGGEFTGDWIAMGKEDQSEMFVSRYPPA